MGACVCTVQGSARSLKVDKRTLCAVLRKQVDGIWYMWVFCVLSLFVLYSNYTDETRCKALSLQCSSSLPPSLPLSLQVCDFMYNYLHNYSSLHPTVSGGLFLSRWYRLSFFLQHICAHTDSTSSSACTVLILPPFWLMLGLVLSPFFWFCLMQVCYILYREQSRYSVHEETSGLLVGCHASSLIIHSDIANLKSLKVCHREWWKNKMLYFSQAYYLKVSETVGEGDRRTNTDSSIVNLYLLIFWRFLKAHGWCQ